MKSLIQLASFLLEATKEIRRSRLTVVFIILASVAGGAVSTSLIAVVNAGLHHPETIPRWGFLLLCLALPGTRFLAQFLLVKLAQGVTFELHLDLSRRILATPLRKQEEMGPSRLLATLTDDVKHFTAAVNTLPMYCVNLTIVFGCGMYFAWLSWQLFLVLIPFVAVALLSYQLPVRKAQRFLRLARQQRNLLFDHFRGLTDGGKELRVHRQRRKAFLSEILEPTADALRRGNIVGNTLFALAGSWGQLLAFGLLGVLLLFLPQRMLIEQAVLSGYVLGILYIAGPIEVMVNNMAVIGRALVAIQHIEEIGILLPPPDEDAGSSRLAERAGRWSTIELRGVQHTYYQEVADDMFTLGPLDLELRPAEVLFIIGGNGSGKTTLAKLIMGLYAPEDGEIRVDGEPLETADFDEYRQLFTVVFSDFYLFEKLLGLGQGREIDATARDFLEKLHLDRKVRVVDGALSTVALSQGQRKRLALLTAFLEDRSIFVFDEWAADQDPYFKDIFYRQIIPELKSRGKTVIAITHDQHYHELADRLITLSTGQIEYDGPPAGLLGAGRRST